MAAAGFVAGRMIGRKSASVFVARHQRYDGALERTIEDGFAAVGLDRNAVRGRRVLLKPNLVEPNREVPWLTTHPAVIVATAEVFRRWGASVRVGEGPGHVRDSELALAESGVQEALEAAELEYVDLNYDDTGWIANAGKASRLPGFHFPRAVLDADLIVSLPKMKTHHWVGATLALKNLYGTLPGIKYGWPKNVLHHAGIPQTVYDINATLPKTVTVVDGIDCMEGDGPIMGTMKPMGLILVGLVPAAVDATACRIMGLVPERLDYLRLAGIGLGPITETEVEQRGEAWSPLRSRFQMVDRPHLNRLLDVD